MSYESFQIDVIELGSRGVPLTVANVVAHLRVPPARVQRALDRMAREGLLDLEVDENEGFVVYRVRGLSTIARRARPRETRPTRAACSTPATYARHSPLTVERKSVTVAVVLGALVPGIGLAYAAPLRVVLAASLLVLVFGKVLVATFIFAPLFWVFAIGVSALFGGLYAVRYNQEGHRARLLS
ncbi:helix-turn-helix domain-containing protein [Polyangium sp. y55x31]|uniref:helix-turn-helix domain-containing protein n=1 Tax=Polyangium sp. y55x31 TaxID=3042688 RepID=UPI0024824780|nr:helix-turn-helix domain-containing protein [Polyangium sp. y55x31]MDI1475857.1 helix-turn-helix domain-containing protein [Polyangium sp. y55x31]